MPHLEMNFIKIENDAVCFTDENVSCIFHIAALNLNRVYYGTLSEFAKKSIFVLWLLSDFFPKIVGFYFCYVVIVYFKCSGFPCPSLQVTVEYKDNNGAMEPLRVHTVVISVQHKLGITLEEIRSQLMEKVVKVVIPSKYLDDKTIYHLLPSGLFLMGGPQVGLLAIGDDLFRTDHVCLVCHNFW